MLSNFDHLVLGFRFQLYLLVCAYPRLVSFESRVCRLIKHVAYPGTVLAHLNRLPRALQLLNQTFENKKLRNESLLVFVEFNLGLVFVCALLNKSQVE